MFICLTPRKKFFTDHFFYLELHKGIGLKGLLEEIPLVILREEL